MKRLTSLLLAFMLVLSLAACGEESTPNIDDGASQSQSENTSPDSAGQTSNSSSDEVSTSNIDDKANQSHSESITSDSTEETSNSSSIDETAEIEDDVPSEYKSALKKAESYSDLMHMSKAAIYDQLTSEYGEKFTAEAAQYAIDNLEADWNANAIKKAESYSDTMHK